MYPIAAWLLLALGCSTEPTVVPIRFSPEDQAALDCLAGDAPKCLDASSAAELKGEAEAAARWADLGCDAKDSTCCFNAGVWASRRGDSASATARFTQACDLGDLQACTRVGNARLEADDAPGAMVAFEKACAGNEPIACGNLAVFLFQGELVPKDAQRALDLWRRSCDAGDAQGCHNLGYFSLDGINGMPRDKEKAEMWLLRGCELDFADSCGVLSEALTSGRSLSPDPTRAAEFAAKACSLGEQKYCP